MGVFMIDKVDGWRKYSNQRRPEAWRKDLSTSLGCLTIDIYKDSDHDYDKFIGEITIHGGSFTTLISHVSGGMDKYADIGGAATLLRVRGETAEETWRALSQQLIIKAAELIGKMERETES
jgi:hypothetical protein